MAQWMEPVESVKSVYKSAS